MANQRWRPKPSEEDASKAEDQIAETHQILDDAGISRYSGLDEMPPDTLLDLPERVRRLTALTRTFAKRDSST